MKKFKKSLNEDNPAVNLEKKSFIKKVDNKKNPYKPKDFFYIEFDSFDLDTHWYWIYENKEDRDKDYESMVY